MTTDDALRSSPAFRALMEAVDNCDHGCECHQGECKDHESAHHERSQCPHILAAALALAREQQPTDDDAALGRAYRDELQEYGETHPCPAPCKHCGRIWPWPCIMSTRPTCASFTADCRKPSPSPSTLPAADAAREDVIRCAMTMNTDNEIDGWQGNVNISMALDAYAAAIARPLETRVRELETKISAWVVARDYAHGKAFKVGDPPLVVLHKAEDELRAALDTDSRPHSEQRGAG